MTVTIICLALLIRIGLSLYTRCIDNQEEFIRYLRASNGQYSEQYTEVEIYDPIAVLRVYRKADKLIED